MHCIERFGESHSGDPLQRTRHNAHREENDGEEVDEYEGN